MKTYIKSQKKSAESLGIDYQLHKLTADVTESHFIDFIQKLNANNSVHGIIIQMPLPSQIDYKKMSQFIAPEKDAEGMHPINIGKILLERQN